MPTAHAQRATEVSDVTLKTKLKVIAIKARENAGDQVVICKPVSYRASANEVMVVLFLI